MTPEEEISKLKSEIVELKAKISNFTSKIELIERNLSIKTASDQELDNCKSRLDHIESHLIMVKHYEDTRHITTNPQYPPYFPYTSSVHIESKFTQPKYQHCCSNLEH